MKDDVVYSKCKLLKNPETNDQQQNVGHAHVTRRDRECSSAAFPEDAFGLLHLWRVDT